MSKRNVFSEVGGLHPRRSVFDLSYEKKTNPRYGSTHPGYV